MEGRFIGREIINKPKCPFCGVLIKRPVEVTGKTSNALPVGMCTCGATYACDVTGHDLGNAMIDALVFSCNGDWNQAWDLLPEEDYIDNRIENYDLNTHQVVHGGAYEGRQISGVLFFIKLLDNQRLSVEDNPHSSISRFDGSKESNSIMDADDRPLTKREVETLVTQFDLDPILKSAGHDKKLIRNLKRLLYSADNLTRYRAADILGQVAAIVVGKDSAVVTKLLDGLFTSMNDSAASSWGYLDAIGEIISNSPDLLADYVPRIYQFARDRSILPDVLRIFGKICEARPELFRKNSFQFFQLLDDDNPEIRGYTAILLGNIGAYEARGDLEKLIDDTAKIGLYRDGDIVNLTIGQLAAEAIEKI